MNRREFLTWATVLRLGLPLRGAAARPGSYETEMPDMLLAYLSGGLNAWAERWDRERSKIRTPADVEARNRFVREKLHDMLGRFPERGPVDAEVVNKLERKGYRVENVMFQSRPNFWVTGNLYVPTSASGPFPGIISPCGHYPLARMQPDYQFAYLNLVKSGFVVLAYDPIGQGERRQYWNPQTNQTESSLNSIYEHSMPGQLLILMGENLTEYRVWDGMRAIDYLLTRAEVDKVKIGCAGHSGGGTLTMFISALDERVQCAVINEGGTAHRWPLHIGPGDRVGPSDVEQNLFPAAVNGVDLCDLHVAIAPRPLLALIEDYSPRFSEAAAHIRARYEQLGVPEKFATEEATDPHAWTVKLRLATTDWFSRWFYGRRGPEREPDFEQELPETLYCTPNGSIRYSQRGATIFSLILQKQAHLPPARELPSDVPSYRREIASQIKSLLRYTQPSGPVGVRQLVTTPRKGYQVEKLEFISEPGIYIPAWAFVPEHKDQTEQPILFVHEAGKEAEGMEFGLLERLARKGRLVVAIDVRGIGATRPPHVSPIANSEFRHLFDVETAMSYMAWFIDRNLFVMRVQDVVRAVDYALSREDVNRSGVLMIGRGMGGMWALYAAALDSRISAVVCESGLVSYKALTQTDRYLHGADIFIPHVLRHFDLPQVAAAVASRPLALLAPVDAMKHPLGLAAARRSYEWTTAVYARAGAEGRFRMVGRSDESSLEDQYLSLLSA